MSPPRPCLEEPKVSGPQFELLVARMRSRCSQADLDCRCREEIENSIEDLCAASADQAFVAGLIQARAMREAITKLIGYLVDLNELDANETDLGAFAEMAGLFEDIGHASGSGAAAMRTARANHPCRYRLANMRAT